MIAQPHSNEAYDLIVVGAGVNGSATAYAAAKRGLKVLLLEKFPLPHTRGSSHGQSRIIRTMYQELLYAQMTKDSFPIWRQLEREVGDTLLIQNGMLQIFSQLEDKSNMQMYLDNFDALNVEYKILSPDQLQERFPLFNIPAGYVAVHEPGGGTVLASKCVLALVKIFRERYGGKLHDTEEVIDVKPGAHHQYHSVCTSKATYSAKHLVITAGAWTSKLMDQLALKLPIQPTGVHACYWRVQNPQDATIEKFPSFVWSGPKEDSYGLAAYEYPGMIKVCNHSGTAIHPDKRSDKPDLDNIVRFISKFMNGVDTSPSIVEECIYSITPDHQFIVDRHPSYPTIAIGAGFSGHGFKMAPITGELLLDLALGYEPKYNIESLRLARFHGVANAKSSL